MCSSDLQVDPRVDLTFVETLADESQRPILWQAIIPTRNNPEIHRRSMRFVERNRAKGRQIFGQAGTVLAHMFTPTDGLSLKPAAGLLVVVCLCLTFLGAWIGTRFNLADAERRIPAPVMGAALAVVILFALLLFPEDCRTFIYFQF